MSLNHRISMLFGAILALAGCDTQEYSIQAMAPTKAPTGSNNQQPDNTSVSIDETADSNDSSNTYENIRPPTNDSLQSQQSITPKEDVESSTYPIERLYPPEQQNSADFFTNNVAEQNDAVSPSGTDILPETRLSNVNPSFSSLPAPIHQTEVFSIEPFARKVDILFVVDNSSSMIEEQTNLARSFKNFIDNFKQRALDFHIAVLSTDHTPPSERLSLKKASGLANFQNQGPGTFLSYDNNDRVLSNSSSRLEQQFVENVSLGTDGSGSEMGILSVIKALSPDQLNQWNKDFLRKDALLSVIFVSDEDESIAYKEQTYIHSDITAQKIRLESFSDSVLRVKNNNTNLIRVDAVVRPDNVNCKSGAAVGISYMQLAKLWSGTVSNICQDFSADLKHLGKDLSEQAQRRLVLQHSPLSEVQVRSGPQPLILGRDYIYNKAQNFVELSDSFIQNSSHSKLHIEISYKRRAQIFDK